MKQIGFTLPVEIIEIIINYHLASFETSTLYINALKRISLVCLHFLERMRRIKFKTLKFQNDDMLLCISFESSIEILAPIEHPLHLHQRTPGTNRQFPHYIFRCVKEVVIAQSQKAYSNFNRWMKGPLFLDTLRFDANSQYMHGLMPLNMDCIAKLENINFSYRSCLNPLFNLSASLFQGLKSVKINCFYTDDFLRLSRLSVLNAATMLILRARCLSVASSITIPVHELNLTNDHGTTLDCFKSYTNTLTKLDFKAAYLNREEFKIDTFLSSATKLQELTLWRFLFRRSSLLATLQAIKNLKDLRLVTFITRGYSNDARSMQKITFKLNRQKLESIEITHENYHYSADLDPLDWLIEELLDLATITLKDVFVRSLFECMDPVNLKFMMRGKTVRTREEYERGFKVPGFD